MIWSIWSYETTALREKQSLKCRSSRFVLKCSWDSSLSCFIVKIITTSNIIQKNIYKSILRKHIKSKMETLIRTDFALYFMMILLLSWSILLKNKPRQRNFFWKNDWLNQFMIDFFDEKFRGPNCNHKSMIETWIEIILSLRT